MNILTNGFGGTAAADPLASCAPYYTSGDVWFVSSITGNDSNTGTDREAPKATLAAALGACASGDTIVLMSGHAEAIMALTAPDGLTLVGEGVSSGLPTVVLTPTWTAGDFGIDLRDRVEMRNIRFASWDADTSAPAVRICRPGVHVYGCRFDCGSHMTGAAVQLLADPSSCVGTKADDCHIESCSFVSTATAVAARPGYGIYISSALSGLRVENVVIDDGTVGFSSDRAIGEAAAGAYSKYLGIAHLRGATTGRHASGSGYYNPQVNTGGGRVVW